MTVPASANVVSNLVDHLLGLVGSMKAEATKIRDNSANRNITSDEVFKFLDRFYALGLSVNERVGVSGINDVPINGYSGVLTDDIASSQTAALAVITWIHSNFPTDGTYVQSHILNANGSRTPREFTPQQTTGFRTALDNFMSTVS